MNGGFDCINGGISMIIGGRNRSFLRQKTGVFAWFFGVEGGIFQREGLDCVFLRYVGKW